jgi:hypothetical protein
MDGASEAKPRGVVLNGFRARQISGDLLNHVYSTTDATV